MRRRDLLRGGAGMIGGLALGLDLTPAQAQAPATTPKKRVILVWSEATEPKSVYPNGINGAVAEALKGLPDASGGYEVRVAALTDPEQGVSEAALNAADVLFWWGHQKHGQVADAAVARIVRRVKEDGMGVVFLHSAHFAKPLKAVLGASGAWKEYTNDGKPHRITVADRNHPIARGVRDFVIPKEERYEEPFVVPPPEAVVFNGFHESTGTTARQGLCWTIGKGRVFYFRPGHEEYPVFQMPEVRRIVRNAALWAARDEAGIWEDNDPADRAARAAGEPPLALILREVGYGGTNISPHGEIDAQWLVRASKGPVTFTPLAAFGVLRTCSAGWFPATSEDELPKRTLLWKIDGPNNKRMHPPLAKGAKTTFDPGDKPFGLWISTEAFPGEVVYTADNLQKHIPRFNGRHKAHAFAAVRTDGTPVPNALLIGFEYSTNDDNQEVVALVENVRPFGG